MISKITTKEVDETNSMLFVIHHKNEEDHWAVQDLGLFSSHEALLNELSGHGLPIIEENEEHFEMLDSMGIGDHYSYRYIEFLG